MTKVQYNTILRDMRFYSDEAGKHHSISAEQDRKYNAEVTSDLADISLQLCDARDDIHELHTFVGESNKLANRYFRYGVALNLATAALFLLYFSLKG